MIAISLNHYTIAIIHFMHEFATEAPGFTIDTPVEQLGSQLNLPDFLEGNVNKLKVSYTKYKGECLMAN